MALPRLTPEEKRKALEKAQAMRSRRAQMRQELKDGKLTLEKVLSGSTDEIIGKMRVAYLLESLPRIGKVKSAKIMEELGINESRRVQGLGARQREALLERLAK